MSAGGLSRRGFLRAAAGAAAAAWLPLGRARAMPGSACPVPAGFPPGVELYRQAFRNWSGEVRADDVWTAAPRASWQVPLIADWALEHGYRLRASGMRHGWSPLTLSSGEACPDVVLVDTTQHLTRMRVGTSSVTAETGVTMEAMLGALEGAGLGLTSCPAPGEITVGGVVAIDGHGASVPAAGEVRAPGKTFGSVSNLVLSATAVVYDEAYGRFVRRTFERDDPACAALLTNLGRTFLTEVTLQAGENDTLRCVSLVDVPAAELFAAPGSGGRTFASYLDETGRAEAILFPFTEAPWLKVWSVAPDRPLGSRRVEGPYNYPFSDNVPEPLAALADAIVRGNDQLTPVFGQGMYEYVRASLAATDSADLWGPSKDLLLYVRSSTLRVTANGYAVHTSRDNVQSVLADFYERYTEMVEVYRARGSFPMNMPLEIRVTGLDRPDEVERPGAQVPALSALAPRPDHPEWDVAVWFDALSFPGTRDANDFYRELEGWMLEHFSGARALVRPEWSKAWAYGQAGAWSDETMLTSTIPATFGSSWQQSVATLDALDPYRVFGNAFLDEFLR